MAAKQDLYFVTIEAERERNMMVCEEVISKFGTMKEENEAAIVLRDSNKAKLSHYDTIFKELAILKTSKQEIKEKLDFLQHHTTEQDERLKQKDEELEKMHANHKIEVFDLTTEFKIKIQELEQKATAEKLKAQSDKNNLLKDKREM